MRSAMVLSWLLVVYGLSTEVANPAQVRPPAPGKRFAYADDVRMAVSLLGYKEVHVLRWAGGGLRGWFYFVKDGRPEKFRFDMPKGAKGRLGPGEKYDPSLYSGWIIIAIKPPSKKAPRLRECLVSYVLQRKYWDGNEWQQEPVGHGFDGLVPAARLPASRGMASDEDGGGTATALFTAPGGKEYQLYQLTLE